MDKMRRKGTPLHREWDVSINYGIKTGYNAAFVIDGATREALIAEDPNSDEIIEPVLRGRDIQRYNAEWAGQWLIVAKYGSYRTLSTEFPAVYRHLLLYEDNLRARGQCQYSRSESDATKSDYPGQHHWLELDNNPKDTYLNVFNKEKLFWMDLTERGRFAYVDAGMYGLNSLFIMTGPSLTYLCGVLNSTLVTWYMGQTALNSGMGVTRWITATVSRIPVPRIAPAKQEHIAALVNEILAAKAADSDADTRRRETEIDDLVYDLYGLTEAERTAVERSLGLIHPSDEEEDAALGRVVEESLQEGRGDTEEVRQVLREETPATTAEGQVVKEGSEKGPLGGCVGPGSRDGREDAAGGAGKVTTGWRQELQALPLWSPQGRGMIQRRMLFADAGYWIALWDPGDALHSRATAIANNLGASMVLTTHMVLVEALNYMARLGEFRRQYAVRMVQTLESSPSVEIIPQTDVQFRAAFERYAQRTDQTWSLTDCASFLVMEERGITEALAYDDDFKQAGFVALLREGQG